MEWRDMVRRSLATGLVMVLIGMGTVATWGQNPPPPPPPPPPPTPPPPGSTDLGRPLPGLSADLLARFEQGRQAFLQPRRPRDGLGPVFNDDACAKCHGDGAVGGAGLRTVTRFGRLTQGRFDPMTEFGGMVQQNRGIGVFNGVNFVGEVVPPQATIVARRRTTPTFGLGLVEAIPDASLQALASQQASTNPAIAGRVSLLLDLVSGTPRVGRFGWKAQHATLFTFTGDALVNEMGITTPLFPQENCPQGNCSLLRANPASSNPNEQTNGVIERMRDFMAMLAPPPRGPIGTNERAGREIFIQIGCADCHTPSQRTGPHPVPALNLVGFEPYSDFLLHDMGPLGDGITQGLAGPRDIKTPPLWGLRFQRSFLHDGRAANITNAVVMHDGQGLAVRGRFNQLTATQRAQLLAFLNSL